MATATSTLAESHEDEALRGSSAAPRAAHGSSPGRERSGSAGTRDGDASGKKTLRELAEEEDQTENPSEVPQNSVRNGSEDSTPGKLLFKVPCDG